MFWTTLRVKPAHRLIVLVDGRLRAVLKPGQHTVWHGTKPIETFQESVTDLKVTWPGVAAALRFERAAAEKYWRIVDTPAGFSTVVWHRHLPPQVVGSNTSAAFWLPEDPANGIETHVLPQQEYWLPEAVQSALLAQPALTRPLQKFTVRAYEKLLLTVRGRLTRVLGEGEYVLHMADDQVKALFADTRNPLFDDIPAVELWAAHNPELVAEWFQCLSAADNELIFWSLNGKLEDVILPGRHRYFWKNAGAPEFRRVALTDDLAIDAATLARLEAADYAQHPLFKHLVLMVDVPPQHQALLHIKERPQPPLGQGRYAYYRLADTPLRCEVVDLRLQTAEVSGQELLTEDKVTVRANLTCNYRITDAPLWLGQHSNPAEYLYRELQFALRAVVGGKSMDQLLADKEAIDAELTAAMRGKTLQGAAIDSVGLKDIILPGEIRAILTRVVEAEKSAQANNIRRREETAATRSLLNTARVMEENPTALRLKELETLEKVTEKIDKISVFGGLDGVLKGLINIRPGGDAG